MYKLQYTDDKPNVVDSAVDSTEEVGVTITKSSTITWGLPTRPSTIYQEPMKKNSLFIGGLTWVRNTVAVETHHDTRHHCTDYKGLRSVPSFFTSAHKLIVMYCRVTGVHLSV